MGEIKSERLLQIYSWLVDGRVLNKQALAEKFHVAQRSIQRDIEDLRCFLAEQDLREAIVYDKSAGGYRMENITAGGLSNSEILAVCKILLESRSLRRDEMLPILDKLVTYCGPDSNKAAVTELIANEKFHYIQPHHNQPLLDKLWELGEAVRQHRIMEIQYERMKEPNLISRQVEPVGIMFSEYYFYLIAFSHHEDKHKYSDSCGELFPTIYRADRIRKMKVLEEHFMVPYAKRFEEGEFRRRIQFMYGGKLQTVQFKYTGPSVEAVLDRLPTAEIISHDEEGWLIRAEVFGKGIDMWLKSQGDYVQMQQN